MGRPFVRSRNWPERQLAHIREGYSLKRWNVWLELLCLRLMFASFIITPQRPPSLPTPWRKIKTTQSQDMGFASFTCAKTHLPIMAGTSWPEPEFCNVVMLTPNGDTVRGTYDGYCNLSTEAGDIRLDFDAVAERGEIKLVLAKFYQGEKFADLGVNGFEYGQGHFHDMGYIRKWYDRGGFKTYEEYKHAYEHA